MAETSFSHSHLESPSDGTLLSAGAHTFRGWVWPKAGGLFTDVRARVGSRLFPGVHGLPRADLAAHFGTRMPVALAGFYIDVELLDKGSTSVFLEVLEIEGRWRVFQQVTVTVQTPLAASGPITSGEALRWIDHGHGLRLLLRELSRTPHRPLEALAKELATTIPSPRILRHPPPPFIGFVDEPASVCCNRFGRIPAFGHIFHPEHKIRHLWATTDLQAWQPLEIGRPSPGPAAHYPQYDNARNCGFVGLVDTPSQLPNPVSLRLYAELEDGSIHLTHAVRTRLHPTDAEKTPYRKLSNQSFEAVLDTWNTTLKSQGFNLPSDAESERFLTDLKTSFDTSATPVASGYSTGEPVARSSSEFPRRILLATHGLSLQGAPRFLLELAQACVEAGSIITVVSAEDGPLRGEFEAIGAKIHIVDCEALHQAANTIEVHNHSARLSQAADWNNADLVIANSFTTFWAVHAAKVAGRPVLFYVHESTTPRLFYDQRISPAALIAVESAFHAADCVSFTTAATRAVHVSYGRPERYVVTPGWAQVAKLDHWISAQSRAALRKELGITDAEKLVCNIGTISDRKGQHTFARAVDLLWRRHPEIAAQCRFILLGGRHTQFDIMLQDALSQLARNNILIHPETANYLRYYLAADVFVCSSYEESSPRVIFEAMACKVPIIASAVHGIPELVRHDIEAVLVPAGDTAAWCGALARALITPEAMQQCAWRARARVENEFSELTLRAQHMELLGATASKV